jgi:hypothetical protein
MREIVLIVTGEIFHARPKMMELHPPNFDKSLIGTLADWGILPNAWHFNFPLPIILPSIVMLLVLIYAKRGWPGHRFKAFAIVLAPFILLVAPLIVELITGFRKGTEFSKLYIFSIFFFCWYPCWLTSRVQLTPVFESLASKLNTLVKVGSPILIVIVSIGLFVKYDTASKWYQAATEVYKSTNPDLAIARALKREFKSDKEWNCIVNRPVMYFYYEPGASLRSFIGGNFFKDFDFWSDSIQNRLEKADKLETILKDLNYPNLYVSIRGQGGYGNWMKTEAYKNYLSEINNFKKYPYVGRSICVNRDCFHVTKPVGLKSSSACLE